MTRTADAAGAPPEHVLMQMLTGMWTMRSIAAAVRLRIPDVIHDGVRTPQEIAARIGAQPRAVHRLLRALANIGVLRAAAPDRYEPTPLSDRLREGPGSVRNFFIAETDNVHWQSWYRLDDAVRTGKPQPQAACGAPVFDYYNQHAEEGEQFGLAMQDVSGMVAHGMLNHYDFSAFDTLMDVGGGNGSLLRSILARYPKQKGIIFDLPYIGAQARQEIERDGLADRCRFEAGDFFEKLPAADVYLLKFILHDWDDPESLKILESCRAAVRPGGRVLLVEMLVPSDNSSQFVAFMDLNMLVMTGGLERTGEEYNALLQRAGFRPTRIVEIGTPFSLIEGSA